MKPDETANNMKINHKKALKITQSKILQENLWIKQKFKQKIKWMDKVINLIKQMIIL